MSFLEWLGRTLAVTLSLMVTLSIIGAIASIPSGNVGTRLVTEETRVGTSELDRPISQPSPTSPLEAPAEVAEPGGETVVASAAPAPQEDIARWLEAITFALLAIAGLMALAVLILFRALTHLSRLRERE